MKQIDYIKAILCLAEKNPDFEIHFCVGSDEICDNTAWTAHVITSVKAGWWYEDGEQIFTDLDEIAEHLNDRAELEDEKEYDIADAMKVSKMAIIVKTNAG